MYCFWKWMWTSLSPLDLHFSLPSSLLPSLQVSYATSMWSAFVRISKHIQYTCRLNSSDFTKFECDATYTNSQRNARKSLTLPQPQTCTLRMAFPLRSRVTPSDTSLPYWASSPYCSGSFPSLCYSPYSQITPGRKEEETSPKRLQWGWTSRTLVFPPCLGIVLHLQK